MGRKTKPEKKKVRTLGASVAPPFEAAVIAVAGQKERNKGWFSGRLLLRGYIAFLTDGQWEADDIRKALNKELSAEQLAIIESQLKVGLEIAEQEIPASVNSIPSDTPLPAKKLPTLIQPVPLHVGRIPSKGGKK